MEQGTSADWEQRRQAAIDQGLCWEDEQGVRHVGPAPLQPSALVEQQGAPGPVPPPPESGPDPEGEAEVRMKLPLVEEPLPFLPHAVFVPPDSEEGEAE